MNQLGRELGLSQSQALQFCRNNVAAIIQMYNDGYSADDCREYLVSLIGDIEEARDRLPKVVPGWG